MARGEVLDISIVTLPDTIDSWSSYFGGSAQTLDPKPNSLQQEGWRQRQWTLAARAGAAAEVASDAAGAEDTSGPESRTEEPGGESPEDESGESGGGAESGKDPNWVWDFGWIKILGRDPDREYAPHEGWLEGVFLAIPLSRIAKWLGIGGKAELGTTAHGVGRIAGSAATRGGVLTQAEISTVRASGRLMRQADGAAVRILEQQPGRFNVVVDGEKGLITTSKNISQHALDRLARNYGWH